MIVKHHQILLRRYLQYFGMILLVDNKSDVSEELHYSLFGVEHSEYSDSNSLTRLPRKYAPPKRRNCLPVDSFSNIR
jgi:hypothetical protein